MKRVNCEDYYQYPDDDLLRPTKLLKIFDGAKCRSQPFELDLSGSMNHTEQLFAELSPLCANVISLNLAFCNYLSDKDVIALLGSQNELLANLKTLNLSHTQITDSTVKVLVTKMPKLTSIDLSGCQEITDVSLSLLAQNCKLLEHLKVTNCNKLTDVGIQLIAQEIKHHLRTLDINDCPGITDKTLLYLGYYCEKLSCLRLKNTRVSPSVLAKLLSARLQLTELNVHGLAITDAFLSLVCRFQRNLRALDLSFCYHVTEHGINKVVQGLDFLQDLHLFGLAVALQDLEESRPPALSLFF